MEYVEQKFLADDFDVRPATREDVLLPHSHLRSLLRLTGGSRRKSLQMAL